MAGDAPWEERKPFVDQAIDDMRSNTKASEAYVERIAYYGDDALSYALPTILKEAKLIIQSGNTRLSLTVLAKVANAKFFVTNEQYELLQAITDSSDDRQVSCLSRIKSRIKE